MRRAQSTTEYAVLIAIVAGALVAMQVYLKRGVQGKIRDLAEQISPQQYEAGGTVSGYTINQSGEVTRKFLSSKEAQAQGKRQGTTTTEQSETIIRRGSENVIPTEN